MIHAVLTPREGWNMALTRELGQSTPLKAFVSWQCARCNDGNHFPLLRVSYFCRLVPDREDGEVLVGRDGCLW